MKLQIITARQAKEMQTQGAIVIHTLPNEHYQCQHIPEARNACVYMVTFLDEVHKISHDQNKPIILYGSGTDSKDAQMAAEKLIRAGYEKVYVLEGGIAEWRREGFAVEGDGTTEPGPGTTLPDISGRYTLDKELSRVYWTGRNQNSKHFGEVRFTEGFLAIQQREINGRLVADMDSIENFNLAGDSLQPVLIAHLKSDDFFFTKLFPAATLTIDKGMISSSANLTSPNTEVSAALELRGVNKNISFNATTYLVDQGVLGLEAHFDIDRTDWGIIYGSTKFFQHLGMHTVFDNISIELRLVFRQEG